MCNGVELNIDCSYPDVVLPAAIFLLYAYNRLDSKVRHDFGYQGKSEKAFLKWLGRKEVILGGTETPISKIFRWFAHEYEQQEAATIRPTIKREGPKDAAIRRHSSTPHIKRRGPQRVQQVLEWLGRYCLYCEVDRAPQPSLSHWFSHTCPRHKALV